MGLVLTILLAWATAALHPEITQTGVLYGRINDNTDGRFATERWLSPLYYDRNIFGIHPYYPVHSRAWKVESVTTQSPGIQRLYLEAIDTGAPAHAPAAIPPGTEMLSPPFWSMCYTEEFSNSSQNYRDPNLIGHPSELQTTNNAKYIEQATGLPFLSLYGATQLEWNNQRTDHSLWSIRLPWKTNSRYHGDVQRILPLKPIWSGLIASTAFWSLVVFIAIGSYQMIRCTIKYKRHRMIQERYTNGRCVIKKCGYLHGGVAICPECGTEQLPALLGRRPTLTPDATKPPRAHPESP